VLKSVDSAIDTVDLKRRFVRGGALTIILQGSTIAIQLTSTVLLARLLSPKDYGIMAMVLAVTNFAGLFRDFGLSSAVIQTKSLTSAQQSNLFWLNVALGALLTVLVAAASPLVVWFYGRPELLWVTFALSFSFLIGSVGSQHGAMLVRNMQFGRQGTCSIAGALCSLAVSIVLALHGWSYWSLVWGNLAGAAATTLLLFVLSPFRPSWPQKDAPVRDMLKFGADVTAFNIVNYFHRNLDNILIGKFAGAAALGYYSRAYTLLMLPINAARSPINAVGFPALSRLANQPKEFREFCRRITWVIAIISMPLAAFLAVQADRIIPLALGPSWDESIPLFIVLSVVAFIQPPCSIRGQVMLSLGQSRRQLRWGVGGALFRSCAFAFGIQWGALGVAISYAAAEVLLLYPSIIYAFRYSPATPADFFGPLIRPSVCSVIAATLTLGVSQLAVAKLTLNSVLHISLMFTLFAVVYAGLIYSTDSWVRLQTKKLLGKIASCI
jgi:PST family polysaccharide transporter